MRTLLIGVGLALTIGGMILLAQNPPAPTTSTTMSTAWADVQLGPGLTAVIVRDPKGADLMIVTTYYWQKLAGIDKPIMRSVTEVVATVKDVAVGATGAPDPSTVAAVHISLVTITNRMEWTPPPTPSAGTVQ